MLSIKINRLFFIFFFSAFNILFSGGLTQDHEKISQESLRSKIKIMKKQFGSKAKVIDSKEAIDLFDFSEALKERVSKTLSGGFGDKVVSMFASSSSFEQELWGELKKFEEDFTSFVLNGGSRDAILSKHDWDAFLRDLEHYKKLKEDRSYFSRLVAPVDYFVSFVRFLYSKKIGRALLILSAISIYHKIPGANLFINKILRSIGWISNKSWITREIEYTLNWAGSGGSVLNLQTTMLLYLFWNLI